MLFRLLRLFDAAVLALVEGVGDLSRGLDVAVGASSARLAVDFHSVTFNHCREADLEW